MIDQVARMLRELDEPTLTITHDGDEYHVELDWTDDEGDPCTFHDAGEVLDIILVDALAEAGLA